MCIVDGINSDVKPFVPFSFFRHEVPLSDREISHSFLFMKSEISYYVNDQINSVKCQLPKNEYGRVLTGFQNIFRILYVEKWHVVSVFANIFLN